MYINVISLRDLTRMSGTALYLYLLVILAIVGEALGRNCTSLDPCRDDRPRDARGCCHRMLGETCGYVEGEDDPPGSLCDTELGYECLGDTQEATHGICRGSYSLSVSDVTNKTATLTWNDFNPDGLEYKLLMTTDSYKANLTDWRQYWIGASPRYELTTLVPGTLYFMRIGLGIETLTNITEVIVFRTIPVDFCVNNGVRYEVGRTFNHDCEDNCTCLPNGSFDCTPICEEPTLPDPTRCRLVEEEEVEGEESCCAVRVVCAPVMADCVHNDTGSTYQHGDTFEAGCLECTCDNGTVLCEYPESCERPDGASCPDPQEVPVEGQCCPEWRCGNYTCEDGGEVYSNGAMWRRESTCQTCNCEEGHVACHDLCEEPTRPENCPRPHLTKLPGSCCDVIECLPPEGECYYEREAYTQGSYLTNAKCELCLCTDNSTVLCTPKQCRTVVVPPPNIFCPHPHIRKDGCCDTLWCENPDQDLVSVIKNLFGTSYSPHSVTLSFMEDEAIEGADEVEGEGYTRTKYQLQYSSSNNATSNDTSTWQKRTFDPRRVHSEDEPVASPTHLLQTTGAIRVGQRVYVTVSGMEANTTYYLKVLVINSGFHDDSVGVTSQPPQYAGALAVRTLAEDASSSCPTTCQSEEVLMVPSKSCPKPVLTRSRGDCCPTWRCYPEEGGCHYKNLILSNGEQIRENCERKCLCEEGNVTCTPLCEETGSTPRPGCRLERLADHCCQVWMCSPRTEVVETMSVTITVDYRGHCDGQPDTFQSQFKQAVLKLIHSQPVCDSGEGVPKSECEDVKVSLTCPASNTVDRRRRDVDNIRVDILITLNTSSSSVENTRQDLLRLTASFVGVFNSTDSTVTVAETVFTTGGAVTVTPPTGNCGLGFIFEDDVCVEGVTSSTPPTTLDVPLNVSASSNSAVLAWKSLRTPRTPYVTGLQIEYREEEVEDMILWNQTDPLDPSVTSHELTRLQAARGYRARLVILTNIVDNNRVRLTPIRFETKPFKSITVRINLQLQEVGVGVTTVVIRWVKLADSILKNLVAMEVRYMRSGAAALANPGSGPGVQVVRLNPSKTSVTISELSQSTAYMAQIILFFSNNTLAETASIHFVTMAAVKSENLLVPLVVSAVVVVCAVAIVMITCCLWRRNRKREARETAFENKTFGLHIETDGRTLSARP
ncbi:uncharacterized protein LOC124270904 [Haliotis rubra]|uniref:uncharacterized protein LOC124270904 n=1 Tax=Haliotis rubra TaxID=36100 RepID=UPI001EE5DCD4|nr:uncharacterized protein LOC124270904 [Haliotis rubra]